jgi:hypothetical protein
VHAGVIGEWNGDAWGNYDTKTSIKVTYNPYQYDTFVFAESKQPIESSLIAELDESGIKIATIQTTIA